VLWPAAERHLPAIQLGIALLVKETERKVQGMVDR
jgi:hypothetical protein